MEGPALAMPRAELMFPVEAGIAQLPATERALPCAVHAWLSARGLGRAFGLGFSCNEIILPLREEALL